MPPNIRRDLSKPSSRSHSPERDLRRGCDIESGGLAQSVPYEWQDLLNLELRPMDFDAALTEVLQSSTGVGKIQDLSREDLQSVIDVLGRYLGTGDVMDGLRKRCFKSLCKICATHGVLPTPYTLKPDDLQRSEVPDYTGGFGAVWKGRSGETTVAIKRLLVGMAHLEKQKERFCREVIMWKRLANPNTLPLLGAYIWNSELVMISEWMENGNVTQYLRKNPRVNKLSLLADVARGVMYLHSMNVVHGDLKGVNILVKDDGSACLADFGLMSIVLDPETADITTSTDGGTRGTYGWMGPELFYPNDFGLPRFQLTKESDCYAFGMVVYEVLSGKVPFGDLKQPWQIPMAVHKGARPSMPDGTFPGMTELWNIAQECWSPKPWDRPTFLTVVEKLDTFATMEGVTPFALREPRPMQVKGQQTDTTTEWQAPSTGEMTNLVPAVDPVSQSSFNSLVITPSQPATSAGPTGFGMGARARLRRVIHVVRAVTKFSKFRFR